MIDLKFMADKIEGKETFEGMCIAWYAENLFSRRFTDVRQEMFSRIEDQLKSAEILPGRHYHKGGAEIVRELLKKGSVSERTYNRLVESKIGDALLQTNAFAFCFKSREVTFQSTVTKRVLRGKFGSLEKI